MTGFYKKGKNDLTVGAGYEIHTIEGISTDGTLSLQFSTNPADTARFVKRSSAYGLFQYIRQEGDFSFILGSRYELTAFGNAVAPRLGITWSKSPFHAKLLYGRAFRVPLLWQAYSRIFFASENLTPETTDNFELEVGYKFSENLKILLNGFLINVNDPITYIGSTNSYQNFGRVGSYGFEGEIKWTAKNHSAFVNMSYTKPSSTTVPDFVIENREAFLAVPVIKINGGFYYDWKKITISPTFTYLGERYGQSQEAAQIGALETVKYDPLLMVNLTISAREIFRKLDLSLQMMNLTDAAYILIQPYYGGHAPMPVHDRQINLSAKYKF